MAVGIEENIDHSGGWDWEDQHVSQSYNDVTGSRKEIAITDIVESGTVLICAGPSDLGAAARAATGATTTKNVDGGIRIVPIGLVEMAQISMNKPLSRIFEIGSKLSYIIPGRTVGGISLSRVFFDGPSLLKALYFGEVKEDYADADNKFTKFNSNVNKDSMKTAHIGSGNMAMNLASTFFDQPVGLAFFFKDRQSDTVSQTYFEGCSVSTYNLGVSANMNVLTESVNIEFVRCRPFVTKATYDMTADNAKTDLSDRNIVSVATTKG